MKTCNILIHDRDVYFQSSLDIFRKMHKLLFKLNLNNIRMLWSERTLSCWSNNEQYASALKMPLDIRLLMRVE